VSKLDHMLEPKAVHRLEVITGTGRRRRFSDDDKARIVEETLVPGAVVSAVARRHGLTPQQLFSWRGQARQPVAAIVEAPPLFVPAVVESAPGSEQPSSRPRRTRKGSWSAGLIEVEIGGVAVRIGRGADPKTIMAVIRALKASA
jgi:transposase